MRTVLPGARGRATTRLGFGMATLMREPSFKRRRNVLEAAYEVGYRHFDVAPLYGLGRAEIELGQFLAGTGGDATVATKFGLRPSLTAKALSGIQGPVRAALKQSAMLRWMARRYSGSAVRSVAPTVNDVAVSLEASLTSLGLGKIDLLLMHDMPWDQQWAGLWADLNSENFREPVESLGISGSSSEDLPYPPNIFTTGSVLQLPSDSPLQQPRLPHRETFNISFGLLVKFLSPVRTFLRQNSDVRGQLEALTCSSLRSSSDVASFLAALSLAQQKDSILLIGTTDPNHVVAMWQSVENMLVPIDSNRGEITSILARVEAV